MMEVKDFQSMPYEPATNFDLNPSQMADNHFSDRGFAGLGIVISMHATAREFYLFNHLQSGRINLSNLFFCAD